MEEKKDLLEQNYLEQLAELKAKMATMVPGDEYQRAIDEHKRLTTEFLNTREVKEVSVSELELHKELYKTHEDIVKMSNPGSRSNDLELAETLLKQRELSIKLNGIDTLVGMSFEGNGVIKPEHADQIAKALGEAVEYGKKNKVTLVQAIAATKVIAK